MPSVLTRTQRNPALLYTAEDTEKVIGLSFAKYLPKFSIYIFWRTQCTERKVCYLMIIKTFVCSSKEKQCEGQQQNEYTVVYPYYGM